MARNHPTKLEARLWQIARKRGYSNTRAKRYVYGTLHKIQRAEKGAK